MDPISLALQGLASVVTIAAWWLMGNKHRWAPGVALASEAVWGALIFYTQMWGLIPVCVVMGVVHARNWLKWRIDACVH